MQVRVQQGRSVKPSLMVAYLSLAKVFSRFFGHTLWKCEHNMNWWHVRCGCSVMVQIIVPINHTGQQTGDFKQTTSFPSIHVPLAPFSGPQLSCPGISNLELMSQTPPSIWRSLISCSSKSLSASAKAWEACFPSQTKDTLTQRHKHGHRLKLVIHVCNSPSEPFTAVRLCQFHAELLKVLPGNESWPGHRQHPWWLSFDVASDWVGPALSVKNPKT